MRILITGGCGFIGSSLAVACREAGLDVVCLDNLMRRGSAWLQERAEAAGAVCIHGDVRVPDDLDRVGAVDVLIECSAEPSVLAGTKGNSARYVVDTNLVGAANCFEHVRRHGGGVIFLSTSRVYPYDLLCKGDYTQTPTRLTYSGGVNGVSANGVSLSCSLVGRRSLYGATKLAAELLLQEYAEAFGVPAIINRCGVVAGPWQLGRTDQGFAAYWMACHHFGLPLRYIGFGGDGKQVRDLLHVDDLCALLLRQIRVVGRFHGDVFNVGGGVAGSVSLCEASAICAKIGGHTIEIGSDPLNRPADIPWYVTDNGNTFATFDWQPQHSPECVFSDINAWLCSQNALARRIFMP